MLSDDLERSLVNQPAAQEAVQWLADLVHVHTVTPDGRRGRER